MPGLRGNLCWGNRGSFSIYGEYPSTGLDTSDLPYVSTNAYYGHHRLPTVQSVQPSGHSVQHEDMEVSEPSWDPTPISRKRLLSDQPPHVYKRIRQGDSRNKEEEDLLFIEHYLKQTHGCDYYSYKSNS